MQPPRGAATAVAQHRVPFFETDAMGIVHHANYLLYFELSRIEWLDQHDRPYKAWIELGLNLATTRIEVDYHASARFDDRLRIVSWLEWVRGASLSMAYRVECDALLLTTGHSEHVSIDAEGRVRRIPRDVRGQLASKLGSDGS